ncbi:MAG TPA: nuclear transport factor 2 family protein [Candidatus Acidoferrales bacterium]|nr:nuclear transport factor 2 family protein [Candidatus Acidoferrales bacterium]
MKKLTACAVLLLFVAAVPCAAQLKPEHGDQRPADRDAIMAHLDKIFQGFIHQDPAALRAGHSAEWVGFQQGSRTIQKGLDKYMQNTSGAMKNPVHMTSYKILEIDITFYGDVAIVPYICENTISGPSVEPFRRKLRILDVFAKLNGDWVQVATNTGAHPETELEDMGQFVKVDDSDRKELLAAREAVWRAYFAGDQAALEAALPAETIAISPGSQPWENREAILAGAKQFAAGGGKLVRLDFPRTDIQAYGVTAIVYSTYEYELSVGGKNSVHSGRATETFVYHGGKWLNTGWHLDSTSPAPAQSTQ